MIGRDIALHRWQHEEPLYVDDTAERREYIADVVETYAPISASVLEIGCNAGSNLLALHRRGYSRLYGADPNWHALLEARRRVTLTAWYGDLAGLAGALTAVGPFDVVLTFATLMHVHPDDDEAIGKIADFVGGHLITCEWEMSGNDYIEARNYRDIFMPPLEQIEERIIADVSGITGYTLRIFRRGGS